MNYQFFRRPLILLAFGAVIGSAALAALLFGFNLIEVSKMNDATRVDKRFKSEFFSSDPSGIDSTRGFKRNTGSDAAILSLDDVGKLTNRFERSLGLYDFVSRATETDLIGLIDESLEVESTHFRRLVQETVFRKFAAMNPEKAVSQCEQLPLFDQEAALSVVFEEWAHVDLDGAIANAQSQTGSKKKTALSALLQSRDDLPDSVRREIAQSVGNEQLAVDLISQSNVEKAIQNPELAWQSLLSDDSDDKDQVTLFIKVAESWLDNNGMGVLTKINNSMTDWRTKAQVLEPLMDQLAKSNAHAAFNFALSISSNTDSLIVSGLVSRWASYEPELAYDAVSAVESFNLRTSLQATVVHRWATDRPREVLKRLDSFPIESRDRAQNTAIVSIAKESPEEAAQLFAQLDGGSNRIGISQTIASLWSQKDNERALEWIISNPHIEDVQHRMLTVVLRVLAQQEPQRALETALSLPIQEGDLGLEAKVIKTVAENDILKAQTLLPKARDGVTRFTAYQYVGIALIQDGDTDQALKLADDLSELSKSRYLHTVFGTWANDSSLSLYDSLGQLPTAELQSQAALRLINNNLYRRVLSDDQVYGAEKFLSDKDRKTLKRLCNKSAIMSPAVITR